MFTKSPSLTPVASQRILAFSLALVAADFNNSSFNSLGFLL